MDFANTVYAKNLFEHQLPQLIKSLDRVADNLEKVGGTVKDTSAALMSSGSAEQVFICYEENSVALYSEAGNVNRMFATTDIDLAKEWAKRSIENAKANGYRSYSEQDHKDLMEHIGDDFASVWVYRNGDTGSKENYGICVDTYIFAQSR